MPIAKLSAVLAAAAGLALAARLPEGFTVHEWGTFTSVAGLDGQAVIWAPLYGPADLPCFVERLGRGNLKYVPGLVRMETPVLYFYAQNPLTLSVRVGFPRGWITEWFPSASRVVPNAPTQPVPEFGEIEWNNVEVVPGAAGVKLPGSQGASHYYAARNTDAAPLRIGEQWEKLIFYRGIGNFQPSLAARFLDDERLRLSHAGTDPVALAIWFENRSGKISYRVSRAIQGQVELDTPEPAGGLEKLLAELTGYLVEFGLYRKEAEAMVETWRDSWFEPGSRVFSIVPRRKVDELLPLEVKPAPAAIARVFVGRTELLAGWVRDDLRKGNFKPYGRFAAPFLGEMKNAGDRIAWPVSPPSHRPDGSTCVE